MIRYRYNEQLAPPAPFVHVTIRCPETDKSAPSLPAQLDTAADRTVIPEKLVVDLGLVPLDEVQISGFGGQTFFLPTYRVEIGIHGLRPVLIEAIAHVTETCVLLARDVLNSHHVFLRGPSLILDIEDAS